MKDFVGEHKTPRGWSLASLKNSFQRWVWGGPAGGVCTGPCWSARERSCRGSCRGPEGGRGREARGRGKGRPCSGPQQEVRENCVVSGGARLQAPWGRLASTKPSLRCPFLTRAWGRGFYLASEEAPWVLWQDCHGVGTEAVHRAQPHLSQTIILVFWFV